MLAHVVASSQAAAAQPPPPPRPPRVVVAGRRPTPATPAVIMIGGLADETDDQCWEWNLDTKEETGAHGPDVAYGWGVQPAVSNYTVTLSFDWPAAVTPGAHPATARAEVELVRALAVKHDIHPPYVMVGHSMGGKTALMARVMSPGDVVAAVVIDTAPWSTHAEPDAEPDAEYARQHPLAAARIRAVVTSMRRGEFEVDRLRADTRIHCHIDVVPQDAPQAVQERNLRRIEETERDFCQVVRHFGAGHAIMVTDPRTIIADIVRYLAGGGTPAVGGGAPAGGGTPAGGGWGEYEVDRRRAAWEARGGGARPGAHYKGRTNIHAADAVRSVMAARHGRSALRRAALRLAGALAGLEDRLCGDWDNAAPCITIPPMTSEHLQGFANNPDLENDPVALRELEADALATAAAVGVDLPPLPRREGAPPLPPHTVAVLEDEAVLALETSVVPHILHLESLQVAMAARLNTLASHLLEGAAARGEDTNSSGEDTNISGADTNIGGADTNIGGEDQE